MCKEQNVIFMKDESFYLGNVSSNTKHCNISFKVSRNDQEIVLPITHANRHIGSNMDTHIFCQDNVTVVIDNDCDVCDKTHIYIPKPIERG